MKKFWRFIKNAASRIRRALPRRRVQQAIASAVTLTISAYLLWYLLPTWLAIFIAGVVVAHEYGHYFTARLKGFKAKLPLFFPGIYMMMGSTQMEDGLGNKDPQVILIGPMVGMILSAIIMISCALLGFMPGVYAAGWMLLFQLWSGTFGSDGKAYRRARNEIRSQGVVVPTPVGAVEVAV